jgi:hypothetical protein
LTDGIPPALQEFRLLFGLLLSRRPIVLNHNLSIKEPMSDLPNFQAWNNENLAKFAIDAYRKMQQQQEQIEQLQGDFKDAMVELRKQASASLINNQR